MFAIYDRPTTNAAAFSRRELLRVGGLTMAGVSLPRLLNARETNAGLPVPPAGPMFGKAKNVIFLYLAGGPPQHETFDPKPDAPVEVRGPFKPIATCVPGIQFCELLPRTARIADKLAVVRSMATDDNTHSSSGAWVLTGHKYRGANARTITPSDWPYFGSHVKRLKPSEEMPPLSTVWLPDVMRLNENVTPAGQTGGFLGAQYNPDVFVGDPNDDAYRIESLWKNEVSTPRMSSRQSLLEKLESHIARATAGKRADLLDSVQHQALDLLTSGKARQAFALEQEPEKVRRRYGRNRWGQCVLLARRLIEAGARLVHVQWPREPGDNAVDNPLWDTHAQNADRLEDVLCPIFDVGFSALIGDLEERGLLDETLVVAIGEFGRTPKINAKGGRDHWGPVFSFALAGAGIAGAQVYGASDKQGAYPADGRVEPGDLTATIYHLLGIRHQSAFFDREGREHQLTSGRPIFDLLGESPATEHRRPSGGDLARVPPFDPARLLTQVDFSAAEPIMPIDSPSRPKGWRAAPFGGKGSAFEVRLANEDQARRFAAKRHAVISLNAAGSDNVEIKKGEQAVLAQEVRSPFAGTYKFSARLVGDGPSREFFETVFLKNFSLRLEMFQFTAVNKQAAGRQSLAHLDITSAFVDADRPEFTTFELTKEFINPKPGSNFSFGPGLGVAIVCEKTTEGVLRLSGPGESALLRIESVSLTFSGKEVNDDVTV